MTATAFAADRTPSPPITACCGHIDRSWVDAQRLPADIQHLHHSSLCCRKHEVSHDYTDPPEALALHHNLAQRLNWLRFTPDLESPFRAYLRDNQRQTVIFTVYVSMALWLVFIGIDLGRLSRLEGSGHESEFIWGSLALRFPVLACFVNMLLMLHRPSTTRSQYEWSVIACLTSCAVSIPLSSYTIRNLALPETSVTMVLLVSLTFFPLGVRLRTMAPLAVLVALAITLSGPLILRTPEDMRPHWVLTGVVWITFVLSAVAAYHREKGLREQFLLRRLLVWEANHDPLTGLANRRRFREHFDICVRQSERQHEPLHLVILDVDHFKLYNDHYGHKGGDEVLCHLASLLQRFAKRPLDLAVRLGGEEFGLLLYGAHPRDIEEQLLQLQENLKQLHLPHATSPTSSHVTVSMGAALISPQDTLDSAILRADSLLYLAKRQGRNCLKLESTERVETNAEATESHTPAASPSADQSLTIQ